MTTIYRSDCGCIYSVDDLNEKQVIVQVETCKRRRKFTVERFTVDRDFFNREIKKSNIKVDVIETLKSIEKGQEK